MKSRDAAAVLRWERGRRLVLCPPAHPWHSFAFLEGGHTFISLRGGGVFLWRWGFEHSSLKAAPNQIWFQMPPETWLSAFRGPTCQVLRAYWGRQEGGGSVPPTTSVQPCSCCLSVSLSAAPEPQGNSSHLEAQKGQFLRLLCTAESVPLATLSWALGDRILSWAHPSGSRTLELVLPRVKAEDAGRYTCRAENRLGSESGSLDLSVQCKCDQQGPGFWEGGGDEAGG